MQKSPSTSHTARGALTRPSSADKSWTVPGTDILTSPSCVSHLQSRSGSTKVGQSCGLEGGAPGTADVEAGGPGVAEVAAAGIRSGELLQPHTNASAATNSSIVRG